MLKPIRKYIRKTDALFDKVITHPIALVLFNVICLGAIIYVASLHSAFAAGNEFAGIKSEGTDAWTTFSPLLYAIEGVAGVLTYIKTRSVTTTVVGLILVAGVTYFVGQQIGGA